MKNLIIILLLFCSSLNAEIKYRLAVTEDENQIIKLHALFTENDASKLLLFPENIQKEIIKNNIAKKRLFVAYEETTEEIISFLKLHIVNHDEINNLLTEELSLTSEQLIIGDCCYNFLTPTILNFNSSIPTLMEIQNFCNILRYNNQDLFQVKAGNCKSEPNFCLYIYLGSSYTHPEHRGHGIYTELLYYAISEIKEHFVNKKFLSLLYGQVEENADSRVMVRVFAKCIAETFPSTKEPAIRLRHIRSRAYKPEVDPNGKIIMIYDKRHQGYGNMVLYKTPVNS